MAGRFHPAILALVACTACWGVSFPLMQALTIHQQAAWPGVSSWSVTAWSLAQRFALAAIVLGAVVLPRLGRPSRLEWRQGFELAVTTAGGMALQMDGLAYTKASTSAFLTQGYAILLPLYLAAVHRRMPHPLAWVAVVLVMLGGGILTGIDLHDLRLGRGELETLGASVLFTAQILVVESPRFAGTNPWRMSTAAFAWSAVLLAPLAWFLAPDLGALWTPWLHGPSLVTLVILALVPTLAGMCLMFAFQRFVGPVAAGVTYCTEPVFASSCALVMPAMLAPWFGIIYANEVVTPALLLGGVLVLGAAILVQLAPKPARD